MKFTVSMKDPDTLGDAIRDAVKDELEQNSSLEAEEREALVDMRTEKISEMCCRKWFEYGEYLAVEIDTEAETCVVQSRK